jgi:hypothetical protein
MQLTIGAQGVAWGDVATWAAAAVALVSACAVLYLGRQANKIADAQRRLAAEERDREAYVLLTLVRVDALATAGYVGAAKVLFEGPLTPDTFVGSPEYREFVYQTLRRVELPTIEASAHRLHVLRPEDAIPAATALAKLRMLHHLSHEAARLQSETNRDKVNRAAFTLMAQLAGELHECVLKLDPDLA